MLKDGGLEPNGEPFGDPVGVASVVRATAIVTELAIASLCPTVSDLINVVIGIRKKIIGCYGSGGMSWAYIYFTTRPDFYGCY